MRVVSEELRERLEKTEAEKESDHRRMTDEIEELSVTKSTLEERLIELLRCGVKLENMFILYSSIHRPVGQV